MVISNREKQADVHISFRRGAKRHNLTAVVDLESIENCAIRAGKNEITQGEDLAVIPQVWIATYAAFAGVADYLVVSIDGFALTALGCREAHLNRAFDGCAKGRRDATGCPASRPNRQCGLYH